MSTDLFSRIKAGPINPAHVSPASGSELRTTSFRNTMDNRRFNSRQEMVSGVMDDIMKPLYDNVEASSGESDLYNLARAVGHRKMMSVGGQPPEATNIEYAQYLAVREDLEKRGVEDIPPWETVIAGAAARANYSREEFEEDRLFNTSSAPWMQTMLGDAGASLFHDPLMAASLVATLPLGFGTASRLAASEMAAAGLAAVPREVNVKAWQEEIGQEYSTEDAVRAVIGEVITVGAGTFALTKGLNLIGVKPDRLITGPSGEVQRTMQLRDALIHRQIAELNVRMQPLQTPVETIYDMADIMPSGAARDSLWVAARDMQVMNGNPAARAYDDGMHLPTGREQELHQINTENGMYSMLTGQPIRVQYTADLAPDLFKVSDDAVAMDRLVELDAEKIVPDLTTKAYQRKLGEWVRESFLPKLLNDMEALSDLSKRKLPTKTAKSVKQLNAAITRANAKLTKLQETWRKRMPQYNRDIVNARATKTTKNLAQQQKKLNTQYRKDVRATREAFREARKEHSIRRGTRDYTRSVKAEKRKLAKLEKDYAKEKERLAKLTDEAANTRKVEQLQKEKTQFDLTTGDEMSRLRQEIKRLNESMARRQDYDAVKAAKSDMPKLERQIRMLQQGKIPKELKPQAEAMHAGIERMTAREQKFADVTIEPEADAFMNAAMDTRLPEPRTPAPQAARDHADLMETVPARETAEELEERAMKLYEAASERAVERVNVHKELTGTIRKKRVTRDAVRDLYNRVNTAAERKVADMLGALDEFVDAVAARGLRLMHNREFMLKVTEGLINGADNVSAVYRPVVKEIKDMMTRQMEEFRALGGHIGEIDGYFPLRHDRQALINAGFDSWYTAYLEMNDLARIIDFNTGKAMTEPRFREISKQMFDDITTDGYGTYKLPASTMARRMQMRFSRPKDYAAFMQYGEKFGAQEGDLYALLVSNLRDMAHDLGIMKELGPKPGRVHADLLKEFGKEVTQAERDYLDGYFRTLVAHWSGDTADGVYARTAQGAMDLAAHMLGSAPVAALGDPVFIASTARLNGLSQSGAIKQLRKTIGTIVGGEPDEIVRNYHLAEALTHSAAHRFSPHGDMGGFGKVNNALADMKNLGHRVSGLQNLTLAMADAMSLDFASELGTMIAKQSDWSSLNPRFQRLLRLNDLNEEDWVRLLKYPVDERGMVAARMLPEELKDVAQKLGNVEMELRHSAINAPDLRARVYATGNRWGERVRGDKAHLASAMTMQFKSFMIQVWANHLMPSMQNAMRGNYGDIGALMVSGIISGTAVLQLREAVKGNPTYEWDDPRLYVRGLMQSGVGGILGDMALKDPNQYGRNFIMEVMGPVPSVTADIALEATKQTLGVAMSRDPYAEANFSPLMRAARPLVPFSNLWYTKAPFDLMITDTVDELLDPGFHDRQARKKKRFAEERGTSEAWWQ